MCTKVKDEPADFNSIKILDDDEIEKIGQEVNHLIDLLDDEDEDEDENDNHAVERYPGLELKSMKRDHGNNGILFINNIFIKLNIFKLNYIFILSKIFYEWYLLLVCYN